MPRAEDNNRSRGHPLELERLSAGGTKPITSAAKSYRNVNHERLLLKKCNISHKNDYCDNMSSLCQTVTIVTMKIQLYFGQIKKECGVKIRFETAKFVSECFTLAVRRHKRLAHGVGLYFAFCHFIICSYVVDKITFSACMLLIN